MHFMYETFNLHSQESKATNNERRSEYPKEKNITIGSWHLQSLTKLDTKSNFIC